MPSAFFISANVYVIVGKLKLPSAAFFTVSSYTFVLLSAFTIVNENSSTTSFLPVRVLVPPTVIETSSAL